jgi:hypothetical protein
MLSMNLLSLVFVFYFIKDMIKHKPTYFTVCFISLITIAMITGAIEYILLILATTPNNPYPRAFDFVFDNCLIGMSSLSNI